nr:hypothetical protein [Haloferax elongans]
MTYCPTAVGPGDEDDGRNITLGYELLLEADPDVLLVLGPVSEYHNIDEIRTWLEQRTSASRELVTVHSKPRHGGDLCVKVFGYF